ncbi:unnamed protein product [Amaranthus hypochondriacus]
MAAPAHGRSRQEKDKILGLPGQPLGKLNFNHYSGYVKVDKKTDRNLFYWLIESPLNSKPHLKPLVLWLNGGPGCSSVAYGAFEEVGTFRVQPDGNTLTFSPYAWNKVANLLFLDSPAGVGFSYSNVSTHEQQNGDRRTARDTYVFLRRWLKRFPQYKNRPFYIAGESYAGHYIPQLSLILTRLNKGTINPIINFKGFLVGNPTLDNKMDNKGTFEYWYNHGLVSDTTYETLKENCLDESILFPFSECNFALFKAFSEFGNINPYNIYGPVCSNNSTFFHNFKKPLAYKYKYSGNEDCEVTYTMKYMNRADVQKAFHVIPHPWKPCSEEVRSSWSDSPKSMLPIIKELINAGVQIWIFSGDTDAILPLTSTRYSINALKLSTIVEWYPWYHPKQENQVGGWSQVYDGLTYVTVRGAGHEVPLTRPTLALFLFQHFLRNQPMPQITM